MYYDQLLRKNRESSGYRTQSTPLTGALSIRFQNIVTAIHSMRPCNERVLKVSATNFVRTIWKLEWEAVARISQ